MFTFLGFVFLSIMSSCKCKMFGFVYLITTSLHNGASAAKESIYQVQVQTLSPKLNISMMNVFTHIGLLYIYNGQVRIFTFLRFVLIFCPYCLAVTAQWIGSFIFINNVFLSWCFCCKRI